MITMKIGTRKLRWHRAEGTLHFRYAGMILVAGGLILFSSLAARADGPATITYSQNFPGSDPEQYSIAVQSDGHARYECTAKISSESDDRESYQTEFAVSDATRARIFELASEAQYFSGKVDSGKRKLAFTGSKKLSYKDGQRASEAAYNYSSLPAVQQLTTLFQSVVATLEFGRRLAYFHRYQKLALDDELKRMEDEARTGGILELQAVKAVLQEIYDDNSVMNVVRARAQRIMEMGKAAAATPAN